MAIPYAVEPDKSFRVTEVTAVDTCPMAKVWYDGPKKYAKMTVAAGAVSLYADDTNGATTFFNEYAPGDWGGKSIGGAVIDITSAAYDSYLEFINYINTYEIDGWHARADGARLSTDMIYLSANTCKAVSATSCKNTEVKIYDDGGVCPITSTYILSLGMTMAGKNRLTNHGRKIALASWDLTIKYASGTPTFTLYECDDTVGTETAIRTFTADVGATTVAATKDISDWGEQLIYGGMGKRLILRATNTAEMTDLEFRIVWRSEEHAGDYSQTVYTSHA